MIIYGDDLVQFYFWIKHFIWAVNQGQWLWLLWSPWNFLGQPFLLNLQYGALHPLMWLVLLVGPVWGINLLYALALGIAFVGQYWFLRQILKCSPSASLTGAVIFTFNGLVFPRIFAGHLNVVLTYPWLPLALLCLTKFLQTTKGRWAIGWLVANYCQLTAGFATLFMLSVFIQILWLGWSLMKIKVKYIAAVKNFMLPVIGFLLITIPILLGFQEVLNESQRAIKKDFVFSASYALPLENLWTFIDPDRFGNPVYTDSRLTQMRYEGKFNYWELSGFVGVATLGLVLLGLISVNSYRWLFAALLLFGLFMSLGSHTPVFKIIFDWVPLYRYIRIPAQHLYIVVFAAASLAALGIDQLNRLSNRIRLILGLVLISLAVGSTAGMALRYIREWLANSTLTLYANDFGDSHVKQNGSLAGFPDWKTSQQTTLQLDSVSGWSQVNTGLESQDDGIDNHITFRYQPAILGITDIAMDISLHAPDSSVVIEISTDQQTWQEVERLTFATVADAGTPIYSYASWFRRASKKPVYLRIRGESQPFEGRIKIDRLTIVSY